MSGNKDVALLTELNYNAWERDMQARLRQQGLVKFIDGSHTVKQQALLQGALKTDGTRDDLTVGQETVNASITMKNNEAKDRFDQGKEKAAGDIFAHLSVPQQTHVKGKEDDPVAMWAALAAIHRQQVPGMRFTAYNNLFNIVKAADESLPSVSGRVIEALSIIKALRPASFDINKLDEELALMAMLRALPRDQYAEFTAGLMRSPTLTLASVQAAFTAEQSEAEFASSAPATAPKALNVVTEPEPIACSFCGMAKHTQDRCFKYLDAQKAAKAAIADRNRNKKGSNARKASSDGPSSPPNGQASALSASLRLASSSHTKADMFWIADTGATSHMSPHRE